MTAESANAHLLALIAQQEFVGMMGLGKLADPTTGEAEVDLEKTRYAIGMLEMLEAKTAGNLESLEQQTLRRVLTALRLNFVEVAQKGGSTAGSGSADWTEEAGDSDGDGPRSEREPGPATDGSEETRDDPDAVKEE